MTNDRQEEVDGEFVEERRRPGRGPADDPLTFAVIGAAQKVHRTLGPGFTEATYKRAMAVELVARRIPFDVEREFEVFYEGVPCGIYRADTVAGGRLVLEYKAVDDFCRNDFVQTKSYLRASGLPIGLLINFGTPSLQVRRFQNPNPLPSPPPNPLNPPNP